MATLLGAQLAFTMIVASILSKLSGHYSFGRWLLANGKLARCVHPSDEELRRCAGTSSGVRANNRNKQNTGSSKKKDEEFTVLKSSLDLQLDTAPIRSMDLLPLQFYTEFQWLMDFAVCALFIYIITELYYALVNPLPGTESNLSLLWCVLVGAFAIKMMYATTAIYFRVEEGGERVLCVLFAAFFLVFAMAILVVDERTLDFGFETAHANFTAAALDFLEPGSETPADGSSDGPITLLSVRIVLAGLCAIIGAFLTFPGLRLARMHTDALRYAQERPVLQLLLYCNIVAPLFVSLAWVRPLYRDRVTNVTTTSLPTNEEGEATAAPKPGFTIDDETAQLLRIGVIFVVCALRLLLVRTHLQAHLNMAIDKMADLRKEAGRISAVDVKKRIVRVYYYLCVVALQYLAPVVLLFSFALMLKTLGDFSLQRALGIEIPSLRSGGSTPTVVRPVEHKSTADPESLNGIVETIVGTASEFSRTLVKLRLVFTPLCFRALLSFAVWWLCTAWFTTSAFGLIYYSYFRE